ncbi:MAG: FadR family transcriptional regulator [Candidatus Accumulibacter sp.]|jgi:GntR family transcriptional repressor for pyruvate dehydrogenase complex|nr:FadR family transcriptional regulator [Accumulibacter sp.]
MTVPDSVFENLCDLISSGTLQSGQRLPSERCLASMLGVSRTSIREALRTLDTLGLTQTRLGSGSYLKENIASLSHYFVRRQTAKTYELTELVEARISLECEVASLADRRVDAEGKEALKALLEHQKTLEDAESFLKADFAFHELIARISTNFFLLEMLKTVRELLIEFNKGVIKRPDQRLIALQHHQKIYRAISEENPDKARLAMSRHLKSILGDEKPKARRIQVSQ